MVTSIQYGNQQSFWFNNNLELLHYMYLESSLFYMKVVKSMFNLFIIIVCISGNGLLAALSMKGPSVYIDQWIEENDQWNLLKNLKEQSQYIMVTLSD